MGAQGPMYLHQNVTIFSVPISCSGISSRSSPSLCPVFCVHPHCSFFKPSDGPLTTYGSCCILLVIHKHGGKFLGKLGKLFSRLATPTEIRSESHPQQSCCPICLAYIGLHSEHGHLVPTTGYTHYFIVPRLASQQK